MNIRIVEIPKTLNIGCCVCGNQACQVTAMYDEFHTILEIIEASCLEHAQGVEVGKE